VKETVGCGSHASGPWRCSPSAACSVWQRILSLSLITCNTRDSSLTGNRQQQLMQPDPYCPQLPSHPTHLAHIVLLHLHLLRPSDKGGQVATAALAGSLRITEVGGLGGQAEGGAAGGGVGGGQPGRCGSRGRGVSEQHPGLVRRWLPGDPIASVRCALQGTVCGGILPWLWAACMQAALGMLAPACPPPATLQMYVRLAPQATSLQPHADQPPPP
jgi:hypothetical protein